MKVDIVYTYVSALRALVSTKYDKVNTYTIRIQQLCNTYDRIQCLPRNIMNKLAIFSCLDMRTRLIFVFLSF